MPTNLITSKAIKWRLAVLMADREFDNHELAIKTGFHPGTISKHKNMRTMPSMLPEETLLKYCDALDCQPGDLLAFVRPTSIDQENS